MKISVEVSARHAHLAKNELEKLFGKGYELKKEKALTQATDFCAQEFVTLKSGERKIEKVRVVGPLRQKTQVEISKTDAVFLRVDPPVRLSGDLAGSAGITLSGPEGEVELKEGLIIALRHIHCSEEQVKENGLKNGDKVSVKVESKRPVTFHDVPLRVKDGYNLCLHLDTDEGNAAGIDKTGEAIFFNN